MTDYDELSYLRQLANKQQAIINAYTLFDASITAINLLICEQKISLIGAEIGIYKSTELLHSTLTTIKQNG